MPKRKASPEKVTQVRRKWVVELPDPTMKEGACIVIRLKWKALDGGEGPSSPAKKIRLLDHVQGVEEPGSSSLDTSKDRETRVPKRKASPEKVTQVKRKRVAELPEPAVKSKEGACIVPRLKWKALDDGEGPSSPAKKIRLLDHVQGVEEPGSSSLDKMCTRNGKRKATGDGNVPPKKEKKSPDQEETKSSTEKSVAEQRREFEAKYVQLDQLGEGGCGTVFAGYRKTDHFPVAIKHIPVNNVLCKTVDDSGKQISMEVAAMLKLTAGTAGSVGTSAAVSLLEWFNLGTELILVMERPIPAMDLENYRAANGGSLTEETAKVIIKQLIEAAKELEDKNIFHRDIKPSNILIETGSAVPRVRLIDFGLCCFFKKKRSRYRTFFGTLCYCPPEWLTTSYYRSGPTTVWQLGAVLYELLHAGSDFDTMLVLTKKLKINRKLSINCRNFLKKCLKTVPKKRPMLDDLLAHPWLS